MLRFGERNYKRKFQATNKPIKIWDVNANNIVVPKLVKKTNSKYLIRIKFDKALLLIMPKMSGYVKAFNVGDKINKLMSFPIDDQKLLE